jgi:hypothetical protein
METAESWSEFQICIAFSVGFLAATFVFLHWRTSNTPVTAIYAAVAFVWF